MAFRKEWGKSIITRPGRLVFPSVAEPKPFKEGAPATFGAGLILKVDDPSFIQLREEVERIGHKSFGAAFADSGVYARPYLTSEEILAKSEKAPASLYSPGKVRIQARSSGDKQPPECYLADNSKLPRRPGNHDDLKIIEDTYYAGSYVHLAVTPHTYSVGRSVGVGLLFKGIKFRQDGERLGSINLDSAFAEAWGEEFQPDDELASGFEQAMGDIPEDNNTPNI